MWSPGQDIRHVDYENQSRMTKITVLPWDTGRSVMKSSAMWDHGHWGMDNGMSLPAGNVQVTLAWGQKWHDTTHLWMSACKSDHQYLAWMSSCVHDVLRCPIAAVEWAHMMSFPLNLRGTIVRLGEYHWNMVWEHVGNFPIEVPCDSIHKTGWW